MREILALVVLLGLDDDPTWATALFDDRAKKFTGGYEFLKQHKYQEARTAFEAGSNNTLPMPWRISISAMPARV